MSAANALAQGQTDVPENRFFSLDLSDEDTVTDGNDGVIAADAEAKRRATFLATFSAKEDKEIRRKVDWRFLWLIGMLYLIKNVRPVHPAYPSPPGPTICSSKQRSLINLHSRNT